METVQFKGESNWDAIINHNSLDIVEESAFEAFVVEEGFSKQSDLKTLERLFDEFSNPNADDFEFDIDYE